ncbi:MAG TPA: hypothetical protein VI702_02960 [Nitrospiria bacterium]
MKSLSYVLGSLLAAVLFVAAPVQAEMTSVSDSDLDAVSGKGDATVTLGTYSWTDDHSTDGSLHKGALDNQGTISLDGANAANVWGAYAGANSAATLAGGGNIAADATANMAVGGF